MNPSVIIRSSPLHGAGVYATAPIKKGSRILEYTGRRLTRKETEGMYDETELTYLFSMDGGKIVIDGFGMAAFINHCCEPNCETDQFDDHIWILSLRDIKAGEELTYDYNLHDAEPGDEAPCYCGTPKCRKTMYCDEEVERQKRILKQRAKRKKAIAGS
ncbi:MAG TPA: SET domain-containing protein-lysine N-methyltransferase [Candidatus Angelobacter sp.]|nr:SET domain-containing protein-lysine N-methyltransferase [Candidatus Angelobacter sp.]